VFPPLWVCGVAALPLLGLGVGLYRWVLRDELSRMPPGETKLGNARMGAAAASVVFTGAIGGAGWLVWLLSELPTRAVAFVLLWSLLAVYFLIAASAFKTQMGRFEPWRHGFGRALRETALHLVEALLWGPLVVMMLLARRQP
jgi:hypothetical protein